jgi:UbiD family decarboxylase
MKVKCITMRKDAIYLDLDGSHREHPMSMMLPLEAAVTRAVEKVVSDLRAVHFPPSGSCSHHAYIAIKKGVQGEGKRAALAALATVQFLKLVVVVDEDIDIYNDQDVLWAISTRVRGDTDIVIIPGVTGNRMDPAGPYDELYQRRLGGGGFMTTKVIIDATKPKDLPFAIRITPNKELWNSMKLEDYLK